MMNVERTPSPLRRIVVPARGFFLLALCVVLFGGCAGRTGSPSVNEARYTKDLDLAQAAYDKGDCTGSAALYSALLQRQETPSALDGLGLSLEACGQKDTALQAFKRAVSLAPNVPSFRVNYGQALFNADELAEAEKQFDSALRMEPDNYGAGMGRAAVLLKSGRTDDAMPVLARLQARFPDRPEVRFNRAIAMYQLGLYSDAALVLADYTAQWRDDPEAWNASGVVSLGLNRPEKALEELDYAISLAPQRGSYYFNRGTAYRELKKLKEAKDDYTRSIMYASDSAGAYLNRGEVRFLLGEKEEACVDLKRACDMGLCERLEHYRKAGQCKGDSL